MSYLSAQVLKPSIMGPASLIESFVSEMVLLVEGPVTPKEAHLGGVALLQTPRDGGMSWNLVSPEKVMEELPRVGGSLHKALRAGLLGYLQVTKNNKCGEGTWVVSYSAAEKGFGPLLYDIGMSMVHPGWVAADRFSVSPGAMRVWEVYLNSRSDVEKEPLDLGKCGIDLSGLDLGPELRKERNDLIDMEVALEMIEKAVRSRSPGENVSFFPYTTKMSSTTVTMPKEDAQTYAEALRATYQKRMDRFVERNHEFLKTVPTAWKFRIKNPVPVQELLRNGENLKRALRERVGIGDIGGGLRDASTVFFSQKVK